MEETRKQRPGLHRVLILLAVAGSIWFAIAYPPIQPHVQLPAEPLSQELFNFAGQPFYITNTMVATLIADAILILVAYFISRQVKLGKMVLEGVSGIFALMLEAIYSLTESTAGKWAKKIFPYFATITLLLAVVNLMELIPGVDSIGVLHPDDHGFPIKELPGGIHTIFKPEEAHIESVAHGAEELYGLYPFVRVASTDLSFTVALALIAVVMIQVIGLQSLGRSYFVKYWNIKGLKEAIKKPGCGGPLGLIMGFVEALVGPLEIVAEFSKIISFSFRLFGNIFAGAVLLFVIGSLVPPLVQSVFLLLELGVGLIQAFVFGMLTMVFMSMATQAHGGDEHH